MKDSNAIYITIIFAKINNINLVKIILKKYISIVKFYLNTSLHL